MATGKGGSGLNWTDFWALFDEDDAEDMSTLEKSISQDEGFYRWFRRRSAKHQKEVLEGAPLRVTLLLIHCLPQKTARSIAENYPREHYEAISRAYFNPPQREDSAGLPPKSDVPRLPAGDKPGEHSVSVQKKIRGRT